MRRHSQRERARRASSTAEERLLHRLATLTNAVWLDPAWDPGVVITNDAGTDRITAMLSRPVGWTQYTVSALLTSTGPAVASSPNGKRIMSFGGAHYLFGAAALAALLQGSAAYSEVQIASRTASATMIRWGLSQNAASPDNRVNHFVSAAGNVDARRRIAAGGDTINTSALAVAITTVHAFSTTYTGSAYSTWVDNVAALAAAANTRAPATLDDLIIGAQRAAGAPGSFWTGLQAGLVIVPGAAISDPDRVALQADLAAYYGY
jgi:hypothetical protein